jgi:hypothetical protein
MNASSVQVIRSAWVLYMAKQWRKYLVKERHDLNEIQLFVNAVKGGADTHGSGWQDLTMALRRGLTISKNGAIRSIHSPLKTLNNGTTMRYLPTTNSFSRSSLRF